jgi:hypothetical protein
MVFHFLSGLISLLTSALVYIIAAVIFSRDLIAIVTFIVALVVIAIIIGLARLIFSPSGHGMKGAMHGMFSRGYSLRSVAFRFKRDMEREVVSGSVARVLAFGTILFLFTNNLFVVYASLVVAMGTGFMMLLAHRHHFSDLVSGTVIGCGIGFLSFKFTPLLLAFLGF